MPLVNEEMRICETDWIPSTAIHSMHSFTISFANVPNSSHALNKLFSRTRTRFVNVVELLRLHSFTFEFFSMIWYAAIRSIFHIHFSQFDVIYHQTEFFLHCSSWCRRAYIQIHSWRPMSADDKIQKKREYVSFANVSKFMKCTRTFCLKKKFRQNS